MVCNMKKIRKTVIIALIIFVITAPFIWWIGNNHNINGVVLMSGVARLSLGNEYVTLTNAPYQILVPTANLDSFFNNYFESDERGGAINQKGSGYRNGIR